MPVLLSQSYKCGNLNRILYIRVKGQRHAKPREKCDRGSHVITVLATDTHTAASHICLSSYGHLFQVDYGIIYAGERKF